MATARSTYTWAAHETAWRERIGIASGRDAEVRGLLAAAATAADQYLSNPFDGSDDLSPSVHPLEVWEGMVAWGAARLRVASVNTGLTAATTGSLQEQYGAGLNVAAAPLESAKAFWWPWRRGVWR
jgi:hypothetical protein